SKHVPHTHVARRRSAHRCDARGSQTRRAWRRDHAQNERRKALSELQMLERIFHSEMTLASGGEGIQKKSLLVERWYLDACYRRMGRNRYVMVESLVGRREWPFQSG